MSEIEEIAEYRKQCIEEGVIVDSILESIAEAANRLNANFSREYCSAIWAIHDAHYKVGEIKEERKLEYQQRIGKVVIDG